MTTLADIREDTYPRTVAEAMESAVRMGLHVPRRVRGGFRTRSNVQWARLIWGTFRRLPDSVRATMDDEWDQIHSSDAYRVLPPSARWTSAREQLRR